ncbi:MAG: hypothetical protein KDA89_24550 [Planctomycetaceae bacterium]|nr:hypothetical protein [Planctomycetaceae bacterium]
MVFIGIVVLLNLNVRSAVGQVLIPQQADGWRFSTTLPSSGWRDVAFSDDAWKTGQAPLGFGEPDLKTTTHSVPDGTAVPITTWFRIAFSRNDDHADSKASAASRILRLKIRADDAFIAGLNGTEIARWNLPSGAIGPEIPAQTALSAPEERFYRVLEMPADGLRSGTNVLAVEVHQCNPLSTDLALDVELSVRRATGPGLVNVSGDSLSDTHLFNATHRIPADITIPDGFADGGRQMQIDAFGAAVSGREILRVDRTRDSHLQKHLQFAASADLSRLNAVDRAARIARYIDRLLTPEYGRAVCERFSERLITDYASREVLIGEVVELCGAGVCRHRALLFKLMADEAGLPCALVRGRYGNEENSGGHTWAELHLPDGIRIADVMNPQPDFYFPSVGEPVLRHYRTVAGLQMYAVDDK